MYFNIFKFTKKISKKTKIMKKTLLIALLFIPFLGISQTTKPIEGFLGLKFGASKEEVIAAVKAKGGTQTAPGKDPDVLGFHNLNLGHRTSSYFFVQFVDNKAYRAGYVFKNDLEAEVVPFYNNLVKDVNDIYGSGKAYKQFDEPYSEGDGYETQGIGLGKVHLTTTYTSGVNTIHIFITTQLTVVMDYVDGQLNDLAEKKLKEKEKGDF